MRNRMGLCGAVAVILLLLASAGAQDDPETILVTYHPKAGEEARLKQELDKQWSTLRRLDLALVQPHLILRGKDATGKTVFFEVLTWKSADIPDHVPQEVQQIWTAMRQLVERNAPQGGIEIQEVAYIKEGVQ